MTDRTDLQFLATLPPGRDDRRRALAVVLVSALVFVLLAPFAKVRLAPVPAFIPIYESALVVFDLITAVLLFGQYGFLRSPALLVLAGGYLFTAGMTVAHALTFPGLFAPGGLLGAGPQSTAWLYMFWHGGFPLVVIAYARLKGATAPPAGPVRRVRPVILGCVAVVLAVVGALTALATGGDTLPAIMQGHGYTPLMRTVVTSTWALSVVALAALWRRRPYTVLDLWLMVVMCVWIFDIALSAVLNAGRFDVGFYAGRIYGLLAASFVLVVLLLEHGKLYMRVVETNRALAREVAERGRAQAEAAAANRAKSDFLSRMSHELRTPLNAILGFGQLLERRGGDERERESVQQILQAGRHLLRLINEVLDIARIEAGRMALSLEPVHVHEAVTRVLDLARPLAAARGIAMATSDPSTLDRYVMADAQRLQQVLLNLVSNAIKYNREGGVLTVAADDRADGRVRLTVSDTGPGIPPELRPRLFTPFERLGAGDGVEGTGLGLALSRRLMELMGGAIGVDSDVGEGSRFWIELPKASAPVATARAGAVSGTGAPVAGPTGVVLYVEDNAANVRLVESVLAFRPSVRLLTATSGAQALELARRSRPAAVLLDLHLPDIPGEDVFRALRADPALARTPVVVVSADATPGQIRRLLAAGVSDYLTKPLDIDRLLAVVDELLAAPRSP